MQFACALLIGTSIAGSSTSCTRSSGPADGEQLFAEDKPGVDTGTVAASPIFPEGLSVADECPDSAPVASTAASALVPLKVGLTLSHTWIGKAGDYEHECLVQITDVTSSYIDVTESCPVGDDHHVFVGKRRVCRVDLRDGYFYQTATSSEVPPVIAGSTMFSLSERSFRELRSAGHTRHRYIEVAAAWRTRAQPLKEDTDGRLRSGKRDREPYRIIVNDRVLDLPTIVGTATLDQQTQTTARILDDVRFPLVLDYHVPGDGFRIQYSKISYPTGGELEQHLAIKKRIDIYGIYFDFDSDVLRPESNPVLHEIADALVKNVSWTLSIHGHTDNIGTRESNLDLSRRRAAAVRNALVSRYAIASDRLSPDGYGASQPRASNNTLDGRATNRRVELVRQ